MTHRALWLVVVLGILVAPRAGGDDLTASPWWPSLVKIDERLLEGKWKVAAKIARKLAVEAEGKSWRDPALRHIMTDVALFRAIAAANLGERQAAIHYWHIALNIDSRRARQRDLTAYGDAAKILFEFPLRRKGEIPPGFEVLRSPYRKGFERPVIPKSERTVIENTGAWRDRPPNFHAEVLLDKEGRIHQPVMTSETHPVLAYATLEFFLFEIGPGKPARMDGEPVDVIYFVTMQYRRMGR